MNQRVPTQLLVEAAKMYYLQGYSQQKVADELHVSRSSISLYLAQARAMGIIEIHYIVNDPNENNDELSKKMCEMFSLKACKVIPSNIRDHEVSTKLVASRVAEYMNELLKDGITIGIAWGTTLHEFINDYSCTKELEGISVVPLVGGSDSVNYSFLQNEMAREFAERINGTPSYIYAPLETDSKQESQLYLESSHMLMLRQKWASLDLGVVGIGIAPDRELEDEDINKDVVDAFMASRNAVCDICARRFDIFGELIDDGYNERLVAISSAELQQAKYVLAVASGVRKTCAIIGGLRSGLISELICDELTIKNVLKAAEYMKT